jgi:hypothetical protein
MQLAAIVLLSAMLAQAALPDPTVTQSGLSVTSQRDPAITLRVADGFSPLRPIVLSLPETDVDRRVFVEADALKRIQRMVVFQFERVRGGSSFQFVYPAKPPFTFGSDVYRIGTYVYDDAAAAKASPGFEAAVTRETLESDGYLVPRFLRTVRLARVADSNGLSEIIIFYFESADPDFPSGTIVGADSDGDLPITGSAATALIARFESAATSYSSSRSSSAVSPAALRIDASVPVFSSRSCIGTVTNLPSPCLKSA